MWVALVPSGMDWLDTEIGGVPAAGVVAALGSAGSGRTSLALGFAVAQLRRQQNVCYLTSETPEAVLETCRGMMELDLRPFIARGALTLLSFAPFFVNKVRSLNSNDAPLGELKELFDERRIQHIVFDTLDPMLSWIDGANAKQFVRTMLGQIQGWQRSVMVTMSGQAPAAAELARTASGSIELDDNKLIVRHAGWCNVYDIEAPLAFVQGRGLVVRPNAGRKPAGKSAAMSDMSLIAAAPLLPDSERRPNMSNTGGGQAGGGENKPWMSLIGDASKLLGPQAAMILMSGNNKNDPNAPPNQNQNQNQNPNQNPNPQPQQNPQGSVAPQQSQQPQQQQQHAPMSVSPPTPRIAGSPPAMQAAQPIAMPPQQQPQPSQPPRPMTGPTPMQQQPQQHQQHQQHQQQPQHHQQLHQQPMRQPYPSPAMISAPISPPMQPSQPPPPHRQPQQQQPQQPFGNQVNPLQVSAMAANALAAAQQQQLQQANRPQPALTSPHGSNYGSQQGAPSPQQQQPQGSGSQPPPNQNQGGGGSGSQFPRQNIPADMAATTAYQKAPADQAKTIGVNMQGALKRGDVSPESSKTIVTPGGGPPGVTNDQDEEAAPQSLIEDPTRILSGGSKVLLGPPRPTPSHPPNPNAPAPGAGPAGNNQGGNGNRRR